MAGHSGRKGPLVRGLCPAGHLVETRAPVGRITWKGPCPHTLANGRRCGLYLTARRTAEQPEPAGGPLEPAETDPGGGPPPPVRKVARYVDHGLDPARPDEPGFAGPAPDDRADDSADDGAEPGVRAAQPAQDGDRPGPDGPDDDHQPPPRARRGFLGRTWDRWAAPGVDFDGPEDDWTVPGIYP